MTVQIFIPCYVDQFAPQVAQALVNLLERLRIPWSYPRAQTCCGQFAFNAGEWSAARRLMRHFLDVFQDAETIICPGASCVHTIRRHYPRLVENATDATRLQALLPAVRDCSEWLAGLGPLPWPLVFPGRVFLHQSCTARQLGSLGPLRDLLGRVAGLELRELSPAQACCGFGGLFAAKRPDLSQAIGANYLAAIRATDADVLISPDVGCLLHLQGFQGQYPPLPAYQVVEFIQRAGQDS